MRRLGYEGLVAGRRAAVLLGALGMSASFSGCSAVDMNRAPANAKAEAKADCQQFVTIKNNLACEVFESNLRTVTFYLPDKSKAYSVVKQLCNTRNELEVTSNEPRPGIDPVNNSWVQPIVSEACAEGHLDKRDRAVLNIHIPPNALPNNRPVATVFQR